MQEMWEIAFDFVVLWNLTKIEGCVLQYRAIIEMEKMQQHSYNTVVYNTFCVLP